MTNNMGNLDRVIRLTLVLVFLAAYAYGWIEGTMAVVLGFFAVILFVTSLVNSCPLYNLFGINSCSRQ